MGQIRVFLWFWVDFTPCALRSQSSEEECNYEISVSMYILTTDYRSTDQLTDLSFQKFWMAISQQRVIQSASCLVSEYGVRGRPI